jgi:GGDEF domain-containing protein
VAEAPVEALVAEADELARDWLLALLAEVPLAAAGDVPVAELARHAPALCAAIARALASDAELDRLAAGDLVPLAARAGRLAGATDPAGAAAGIESLRGVLWSAAIAELRRPDPAVVAELADRLAAVLAAVTGASLAAAAGAPGGAPAPAEPALASAPGAPAPIPFDPPPPTPPLSWTAADDAARTVAEAAGGEVRARDLRPRIADGGPFDLLEPMLAAPADERRTLAVALVELDGIERLLVAQLDGEVDDALERAELAIEGLLRPGDGLRREAPGRLWVALPGTGPAGARALALRMAAAVEGEAHRGVPLRASVGVAVFPSDATDAGGLADHAEEALFAARASGGPSRA